jgi:hypothetical protein
MVVPVAVMRIGRRTARRIRNRVNAEKAVNSADDPADDPADKATDWSGGLAAHRGTMSNAVGNSLRLRGKRTGERRRYGAREYQM